MRDLPDSANLDHLRRQAKDLLVVLKQTDPDATLAGAQASLAEQHGFDTWAHLKAEVERRQDAAPMLADGAVAERLAVAFGLGAVSGPMRHVERQWAGQVWELATVDDRWVLTELAEYVSPDHVEVVDGLVERAIGAGVSAPEPVRAPDGRFVVEVDGANWRADRWMPLGPTPPQPPPADVATEGGRALAQIHALDVPPPQAVVPWLTRRWEDPHWQRIVDDARARGAVWADDLARAIPGFLELDVVCDPEDPNPRAILSKAWHAPTGVRLARAGRLVLVGWEHAGAVPKDWELGSSIMAWSETVANDYDVTAARGFLDGYRQIAGAVPITLPMFSAGVTAGLNWTISRANIALHEEVASERELAERNIRVLARNPMTLRHVHRLVEGLA
jgi:hypothetical protein